MGLYNYFPTPGEGMLQVLVMNTILSVTLLKNMVRSLLQIVSGRAPTPDSEQDPSSIGSGMVDRGRRRGVSITRFKSLCKKNCSSCGGGNGGGMWGPPSLECCVCLCGFEDEEEVSELSNCKHFFHRGCLDKWFDNYHHTTCPLCRSIL